MLLTPGAIYCVVAQQRPITKIFFVLNCQLKIEYSLSLIPGMN